MSEALAVIHEVRAANDALQSSGRPAYPEPKPDGELADNRPRRKPQIKVVVREVREQEPEQEQENDDE